MNSIAETASLMSERGLFVFPVAGKYPLTENGFHDAVSTATDARALFAQHPRATGVGIDCGRSGLLVVDLDGPNGPATWARLLNHHGIVETLEASTGRADGGRHLYFATRDSRSRNSTKKLGAGVDTRGAGGYVISPPSLHPSGVRYRWINRTPIAGAPEWLLAALAPPPPPPVGEPRSLPSGERLTQYGRAALEGLADHVLASVEGSRNDRLHTVARRAGRLVAAGEIDESLAHEVLCTAARSVGLSAREIEGSWRSGFEFGRQYPAVRARR